MPSNELLPADDRSCVFAGSTAHFSYVGATGPVEWTLLGQNRTIRQGETESTAAGQKTLQNVAIEVSVPNLEPGVILPAELLLTWTASGRKLQHSQSVTIFSPDPFSVRQAALGVAQIALFDPAGKTAETFERYDIPNSPLHNLAAIDQVQKGIVIVGEGVSLRQHPNLPSSLVRAAERGVSVLCLAPVDGEFEFPQPDAARTSPLRIAFEQGDVVRRYDKRFDLLPTISKLAVEARRNSIVVRASENGTGWSWFQVDYPTRQPQPPGTPSGRLIVCGMSIIRDWEANPIPRYLSVHLLKELTTTPSIEEKKNDEFNQH